MRFTYSERADAAYICLESPEAGSSVAKSVPCDPTEIGADINLDFDSDGRLIGIEVLGASRHLPPTFLGDADRL
jgi:uncharacterized protein YuzE